ncbi:MAG: hypothetical protein ACK5IN_03845 [Microbacterium sp.]|uniref:hypothetical protein n=1 Tax=Microbacterium sp. TaxID=51671 RepID=UPI003A889338
MASPTPPRPRRHSPGVYRRRRIVVLLVLVAIVAGVWLLIAQPWSSAADAGQSAAPAASTPPEQRTATDLPVPNGDEPEPEPTTATAGPAPSPDSTEPETVACVPGDLLVEPLLDKETYRADENPKLSIALTNTSSEDCTLNVGTSTQRFTVSSGSDVWWRSTDCQATPSDQIVLLAAGQKVTSAAPLEWDRTRSSVATCEGQRPSAPGGGASYHLTVEIAGAESNGSAQFLLY